MVKKKKRSMLQMANEEPAPTEDPYASVLRTIEERMSKMSFEEIGRIFLEAEQKHPERVAFLSKAIREMDLDPVVREHHDPDPDPKRVPMIDSMIKRLAPIGGNKRSDSTEATEKRKESEYRMSKGDAMTLLHCMYESSRENRKCANDDDNMFSNYIDRLVYSMIPNSRSKCGDCRFRKLSDANNIHDLMTAVYRLKLTRRFKEEIVNDLLDGLASKLGSKKQPVEANILLLEAKDLLLKSNPTDALTRINKSLLKSKLEDMSYKFAFRSIVLNELNLKNDSFIDWQTALGYRFLPNLLYEHVGYSEVMESKLRTTAEACTAMKLNLKTDIVLYRNFPRPSLTSDMLPEAANCVEIVPQIGPDGVLKGCRICAAKKINAGDLILSEKSFGSVLTRSAISSRCFNCLVPVSKRFVPCSHCQLVRYCTETCRNQDWESSHDQLCPLLFVLRYFPAGQAVIKILIQHGVKKVISASKKRPDLLSKPIRNDLESFFAYRVSLACSAWTRLNFSLTAIFLSKLAIRFLDTAGVLESKLTSVILEMLLIMHETREALVEDAGRMRKRYGTFVSPVYRMLPICCQPNTSTQQLGNKTALVALRKIEVGEEIRIH